MTVDKEKLKKLKQTHLSYLTDADREAAEVSKEGFVLNGQLIERVENLDELVKETSAPVVEEVKEPVVVVMKATVPVETKTMEEVKKVTPTVSKKSGRKKKNS